MSQDNWYFVTGRMSGDDEDSGDVIKADSAEEAIDIFEGNLCLDNGTTKEANAANIEADKEPRTFINYVVCCGPATDPKPIIDRSPSL